MFSIQLLNGQTVRSLRQQLWKLRVTGPHSSVRVPGPVQTPNTGVTTGMDLNSRHPFPRGWPSPGLRPRTMPTSDRTATTTPSRRFPRKRVSSNLNYREIRLMLSLVDVIIRLMCSHFRNPFT